MAKHSVLKEIVNFSLMSLLCTGIQFLLLNVMLILPPIRALFNRDVYWWLFRYPGDSRGLVAAGLGYFIAYNASNITAQILNFYLNRVRTFKSSSKVGIKLPIFILVMLGCICLTAWLSPIVNAFYQSKGISSQLSANLAAISCGMVIFFIYYPTEKILFADAPAEDVGPRAEN